DLHEDDGGVGVTFNVALPLGDRYFGENGCAGNHLDAAIGWRVFGGIIEQVREYLAHAEGVGIDPEIGGNLGDDLLFDVDADHIDGQFHDGEHLHGANLQLKFFIDRADFGGLGHTAYQINQLLSCSGNLACM